MTHDDWYDCKPLMGFRPDQMATAFDRVRDHHDWKAPIRSIIDVSERAVVAAAVQWFTGTTAEFVELPGTPDKLSVEARGQRLGPGGTLDELPRGLRHTTATGQLHFAPPRRATSRTGLSAPLVEMSTD